jgi:general secretion pathway protein G
LSETHPRLGRSRRPALAIVTAIILVALAITLVHKNRTDSRLARETQLRNALASMRHAIVSYHAKHQRNPASLNDLMHEGELRTIPIDPFTGSNATWKTTVEESVRVDDFQAGAAKAPPTIIEIHSGADGADSTGRAFADY